VPLRKEIKDSLTRQGMQSVRGLHRKEGKSKKGEKEQTPFYERAHKQA